MRKKRLKKWIVSSAAIVVLALAVVVCWKTDVFGKFVPQEPYVKGEPKVFTEDIMTVTNAGKNWIGEMGTGAEPCSEKVPTCKGTKGSESNPFVILEIVANQCDQQIPYLAAEDDSTEPLDMLKCGIQLAEENGKRYIPNTDKTMSNDNLKKLGQWFCNYQYSVYKIGSGKEKENMTYANVGKLYSLKFTDKELKQFGIDATEFKDSFDGIFQQKDKWGYCDVASLSKEYNTEKYKKDGKNLFDEDAKGKAIRDIALKDNNNWNCSFERKKVQDAEKEDYTDGYLVAVEPGKGDFAIESIQTEYNPERWTWKLVKTGTNKDRWIYVKDESEIPQEWVTKHESSYVAKDHFKNPELQLHYESSSRLFSDMAEDSRVTGLYMDIAGQGVVTCSYVKQEAQYENQYSFEYYGLYNKNIIKRQLFHFKSQEEYDNFHLKVITVTPSELNAIAKKDTKEKVDLIERADMFYLGGYDEATHNISNVHELYYKYVNGQEDYDASKLTSELKSFREEDLEWALCYKIIYRLCNNKNLPLMMTQTIGKLLDEGDATVKMYQNETYPAVDRKGTLCNIAKLYIIASQFDLTAKKVEDDSFVQTFYDDYLNRLQYISLDDKAVSDQASTPARETGYFQRSKVALGVSEEEQKKAYYLWNMLTFLPEQLQYIFSNQDQIAVNDEIKKQFVSYGFTKSFLSSAGSTPDKIFSEGKQATHQDGSDGKVGNVAIPHNNGAPEYSTLLGNTESAGFFNTAMDVAYQIMNNRPETVNNQVVKVMKQKKEYVKMSDNAILLDYTSDRSYEDVDEEGNKRAKKSYIKVKIHTNNNGENGLVTKITLKNSDGKTAPVDGTLQLYESKKYDTVCGKDTYGSYTGYVIPSNDTLVAYIPYSLQQWAAGYNIIEVETVGRIYSEKKEKIISGKPVTTEIDIGERTLFNLE